MSKEAALFGLILAGGKSVRMTRSKAFIDYHGQAQVNYLFQLLSKYSQQVYTSCKPEQNFDSSLNPLPDQFDLDTPLNGILTAFHKHSVHAWLSVPVDMPYIDNDLLAHLISNRNKNKSATCYYDSTGNAPEPLLCIWEPNIYNSLMKFYKDGGHSPRELLKQSDINLLKVPDKKYLTNINSPDELILFRKINPLK